MEDKKMREAARLLRSGMSPSGRPLSEVRIDPPPKMIVAGSGIYATCPKCGQLVKLNKWLVGSLHICAEGER